MAIINISVNQFLPITQTGTQPDGVIGQIVNQELLVITQDVHCSSQSIDTNQPLTVQQVVGVGKLLNIDVVNILSLSQNAARTYEIEGANALVISQQAASVNPQQIYQGLAITHSVVPSRALANTLVLAQVVGLQGILSPAQTISALTLTQAVTYFKTDAVQDYNVPVPDSIDYLPVILAHGSWVVTLKIPELGDSDKIDVKRVQKQTRGGDLIIFRDPVWSITEVLKFKFLDLTRSRSQELLRFFRDTIGLSVQLTDHQGVIWNGIILTPDAEVVCTNDNNCGSYEVEFEFQGVQA